MDRPVREALGIIDAIDSKNQCLFEKHPQHYNVIDREARNAFPQGFTATALKWASGFNMYGTRHCVINKKVIDSSCPRHMETED